MPTIFITTKTITNITIPTNIRNINSTVTMLLATNVTPTNVRPLTSHLPTLHLLLLHQLLLKLFHLQPIILHP